jgi:hypothetical protein
MRDTKARAVAQHENSPPVEGWQAKPDGVVNNAYLTADYADFFLRISLRLGVKLFLA